VKRVVVTGLGMTKLVWEWTKRRSPFLLFYDWGVWTLNTD